MTYHKTLETTKLTLYNTKPDGTRNEPVVDFQLSGNNEGIPPGKLMRRLHIAFRDAIPAETEIEPGPDIVGLKGKIVGQIMQWGQRTPDGTGRHRLTSSIVADTDGGEYGIIDSTTNGGGFSMPLILNVGEAQYYVVFHGPDIEIQDRVAGLSVRFSLASLIPAIRAAILSI